MTDKRRRGRFVTLHCEEELLQQARALERAEYFRERYRQRVVVEHRIARLVQLGIRQSRYLGKGKMLLQVVMAAAVANLTLIAGHMAGKPILNDSGAGEGALLSFLSAILAGLGAVGAAVGGLLTALGEPQPFPAAAASMPLHPPRSPYSYPEHPLSGQVSSAMFTEGVGFSISRQIPARKFLGP